MGTEEEIGGFAGFVMDMEAEEELRIKEVVAEAIRRRGLEAYTQDTGGGIVCVVVEDSGLAYFFGTAGVTSGADVTRDEESVDSVSLGVPSDSRDAEAIADAITDAVHRRGA